DVAVAARAPRVAPAARSGQALPAQRARRMIENALLGVFAATAAISALAMLVARHPMRVAIALIACMLALAGIYALLGVHVIAVFQVLIYVGAVMVFIVYVIMLIDTRDGESRRYSWLLVPGVLVAAALAVAIVE